MIREIDRRRFLAQAGLIASAGIAAPWRVLGGATLDLPFAHGERPLVRYPQKRPLLRLTTRPPQLETPFAVFNDGLLTPNDAFFVRYHLAGIPTEIDHALGGEGIRDVRFSGDGGRTWTDAALGSDLGRYSFREWTAPFTPRQTGSRELLVRATGRRGETQPIEAGWNPAGYMRNVVERVHVTVNS